MAVWPGAQRSFGPDYGETVSGVGVRTYTEFGGWEWVRLSLGRGLVALGKRLQQAGPEGRRELSSPSQCAIR